MNDHNLLVISPIICYFAGWAIINRISQKRRTRLFTEAYKNNCIVQAEKVQTKFVAYSDYGASVCQIIYRYNVNDVEYQIEVSFAPEKPVGIGIPQTLPICYLKDNPGKATVLSDCPGRQTSRRKRVLTNVLILIGLAVIVLSFCLAGFIP